jgi:hypothetical protein
MSEKKLTHGSAITPIHGRPWSPAPWSWTRSVDGRGVDLRAADKTLVDDNYNGMWSNRINRNLVAVAPEIIELLEEAYYGVRDNALWERQVRQVLARVYA